MHKRSGGPVVGSGPCRLKGVGQGCSGGTGIMMAWRWLRAVDDHLFWCTAANVRGFPVSWYNQQPSNAQTLKRTRETIQTTRPLAAYLGWASVILYHIAIASHQRRHHHHHNCSSIFKHTYSARHTIIQSTTICIHARIDKPTSKTAPTSKRAINTTAGLALDPGLVPAFHPHRPSPRPDIAPCPRPRHALDAVPSSRSGLQIIHAPSGRGEPSIRQSRASGDAKRHRGLWQASITRL